MRAPILHIQAMKLYGIPNCNSVKAAKAWFTDKGRTVVFHDFRKDGVPETALDHWLDSVGWQVLVNRRGTTWRGLPPDEQASLVDRASARRLLLAYPTLIKRPVLECGERVLVGFDPHLYESLAA